MEGLKITILNIHNDLKVDDSKLLNKTKPKIKKIIHEYYNIGIKLNVGDWVYVDSFTLKIVTVIYCNKEIVFGFKNI